MSVSQRSVRMFCGASIHKVYPQAFDGKRKMVLVLVSQQEADFLKARLEIRGIPYDEGVTKGLGRPWLAISECSYQKLGPIVSG